MAWQLDLRWLLSRQLLSPYTATLPACTAGASNQFVSAIEEIFIAHVSLLFWLLVVPLLGAFCLKLVACSTA